MKTVSVIIPFYSHVDWLYEAIESVLSQTYPIHEIIVINDGSKENMTNFLEKYENRIIYIYQENSGAATARNNGIRIATGDYIAFEDSDDIWLPTKIEKQIAFMEETGAMWSHTGFYYWWPDTNKLKLVDSSRDYGDIFQQRLVTTKIATPAVMLNRAIYNDGMFYFPDGVRNGEDDKLYTMIAKDYKIALIQEPLLKVRMRGSNSQNHAIERFNLRVTNYREWKKDGVQLAPMIHVIYAFYLLYDKIFAGKVNSIWNKIAMCCWAIPYSLERIYVRYLFYVKPKEEKYILRYSEIEVSI